MLKSLPSPTSGRLQYGVHPTVMSIDTTLSVPVFNVLKYIVMNIVLEAIVRTSLDAVNIFFRALDIHHGRPVALNPSRIDRYNLSSMKHYRYLSRWLFTTFLACCAYSIEILLEFSSTARESDFPVSDVLDLYHPTHRACTPLQLERNNTMNLVHEMASSCVRLTAKKYTFYNVSWRRQQRSGPAPVCIHTSNNVLHEGARIYNTYHSSNTSREDEIWTNVFRALRENSWQSNGNNSRFTTVLPLTSADFVSSLNYTLDGHKFTRAVVLSQVENKSLQCAGTLFGRHGAGIMSLRVYGCFANISNGVHYIETDATSIVEADAEFVDVAPWTTWAAVRLTLRLTDFTRGVVHNGDLESIHAFAMLLSSGTGKDIDMINKYAVVYKHCSDYRVPVYPDVSQARRFDKANSVRKITVIVSDWGLVLLVLWPVLLSLASLALYSWGKRKKLPTNVYGEGAIGRRWLSGISEKSLATVTQAATRKRRTSSSILHGWLFARSREVFMNVEEGDTKDDIVVGSKAVSIDRSALRPFKKIL